MVLVLNIHILETAEILIRWSDDHRGIYLPRAVRLQCPCAGCVDEWTGKRVVQEGNVPKQIYLESWSYVGRYAVKFHWSDRHSTGIYSFDYLRRLCPCDQCQTQNIPSSPDKSEVNP